MDQSEFEELLRSSSRPPGLMTSRKKKSNITGAGGCYQPEGLMISMRVYIPERERTL
jgi:hypothetical protein